MTAADAQRDQVELSESVVRAIEDAKFDAAKVEALRLAIMEGNYPLDAKRIAENMLDLERMISSWKPPASSPQMTSTQQTPDEDVRDGCTKLTLWLLC